MPQGRRKIPFSGKAKKEQLKAKKQTKQNQGAHRIPAYLQESEEAQEHSGDVRKLNYQPGKSNKANPNRYALHFRETNEEIKERKETARKSLEPVNEKALEIDGDEYFDKALDFPRRPPWSFDLSKEQLEAQENRYFTQYLKEIEKNFSWKDLGFFELNLETWRQLWRVLEMSDVILLIVDIRYPALMFPPSLYDYVVNTLKKDFILVLNKIDLAPASLVVAWKHYFEEKYPELRVVMFTTLPGYNLRGQQSDKAGLQVRRRKGRIRMAAEGTQQLFDVCKDLVGDSVDLSSWQNKIKEEINEEHKPEEDEQKVEIGETIHVKNETEYYQYERFKNDVLTVGCIGQPNVGKSSLMNAVMGKKVVSVSKTPGHTKHFQTIFLTRNVKLCDCPGLVFPSKVPKPLQVLMGSFPIAQLREPYTTVKFLAERLDLVKLLRINHPDDDDTWSAMDICDGWAKKRGYLTAKAARLDSYRGANSILRMALDGKICLCFRPPSYTEREGYWTLHPEIEKVRWVQANVSEDEEMRHGAAVGDISESSDEEEATVEKDNEESSGSEEEDDDDDQEKPVSLPSNKFAALLVDD